MRVRAASSSAAGVSGGAFARVPLAAKPAASALRGRPRPRRACGPPARKRSRQTYRSLRISFSSRPKALTFSPASIRRTTPSLNSRLKTRGDDLDLDICSPIENCPLFSVSHFRGPLQNFFRGEQGIFLKEQGFFRRNREFPLRRSVSWKQSARAPTMPGKAAFAARTVHDRLCVEWCDLRRGN